MTTLATIVDGQALWQTVLASFTAGLSVTLLFSIAVFSAAKVTELGRDGRRAGATAYGVLSLLALASCVVAIAIGIIVMTTS